MTGRLRSVAPMLSLALSLSAALPLAADAQCPDYRQRVSRVANAPIPGELLEIARIGNRLFVASGGYGTYLGGLQIVNVANPTSPTLVGSLGYPGEISHIGTAITASGSLVIMGGSGQSDRRFSIIETANGTPQILSTTPITTANVYVNQLTVAGNLLYVPAGYVGLYIYDISDPYNPVLLSNYSIPNLDVTGCTVSGSYAYITREGWTAGAVEILDVSDPTAPVSVGEVAYPLAKPGGWNPILHGTDLFTSHDDYGGGVVRWDVSDPTNPVMEEEWLIGAAASIRLVGNRIYATASADLYDYGYGHMVTFDVDDFAAGPLGILRPYGGDDVRIDPPYAYVATRRNGLDVVELLSDRSVAPAKLDYYGFRYPYPEAVEEFDVVSDLVAQLEYANFGGAYGTLEYSVRTLDVTDPDQPVPVDLVSAGSTTLKRLDARSDLAVATSDRGLETASLSPLAFLGWAPVPDAEDVALVGDHAYVSRSVGGIDVVDVADPSAPTVGANVATAGANPEIEEANGYLYVTDSVDGLRIYDLADPANPTPVATAVLPEAMDGLTIADGRAYLKNGSDGSFYVVDVSSPSAPVVEGSTTLLPGHPRLASASGHDWVYALFDWGGSRHGFQVIDVSTPSAPFVQEDVYFPLFNTWTAPPEAIVIEGGHVRCVTGVWVWDYPLACLGPGVTASPAVTRTAMRPAVWAYPNPFSSRTRIGFDVVRAGPATLSVHDSAGRLVRKLSGSPSAPGRHSVSWDGRDAQGHPVAAGVYFLRLENAGAVAVGRTTLVR